MGKKGKKSVAGEAETDWGMAKITRLSFRVTQVARDLVRSIAKAFGISQAEFIERLARQWKFITTTLRLTQSISALITVELIERGWSPEQLADAAQLSIEELNALNEGQKPTQEQLIALAAVLTKANGDAWDVLELDRIANHDRHPINGNSK